MEEALKSNNTKAFDKNHLTFNHKKLNAKYGCSVLFDDGKSKNEIRYKLDITFTGNIENKIKTFRITRGDKIYINDIIQNNFIDKLAIETSKCLYPLHIKTNRKGKLIEILNFDEIINRWEQIKKKIKENYKSKLTDNYIKATEKSLVDKKILLDKISKDWFLNLYFSEIYKFYSQDLYINENLKYPILGDVKPVEYKVISKVQLNEDTKDIRLDISGIIDDDRSALDLVQKLDTPYYKELNKNEKSMEGSCNLIYLFEGKTGVIEAIEANFETKTSVPNKVLVKMFLLKKTNSTSTFTIEDDEVKRENKKGFWSKIFKK
ncbi:hypothetical protein JAO71_07135 [Olleya sp. YSTF-M6]|uniref:Uncharacterized protein n=1 Tax=Olleya sediminilitoris TaxID=2795739 RepID=A0ABS1WKE0_9FLAO|nr:hypothetical protein [Olleya sediminilitoris]MBL7559573.1 hypothetical protein [Olleya sediminilitoris]